MSIKWLFLYSIIIIFQRNVDHWYLENNFLFISFRSLVHTVIYLHWCRFYCVYYRLPTVPYSSSFGNSVNMPLRHSYLLLPPNHLCFTKSSLLRTSYTALLFVHLVTCDPTVFFFFLWMFSDRTSGNDDFHSYQHCQRTFLKNIPAACFF